MCENTDVFSSACTVKYRVSAQLCVSAHPHFMAACSKRPLSHASAHPF